MKIFLYEKSVGNRKAIKSLIPQEFPQSDIRECEISENVLQTIADNNFDIIILDIDTLGGNLLEIAAQARLNNPMTTIVVLTLFPVAKIKEKLLQYGIIHYLDKAYQKEELLKVFSMVNKAIKDYTNDLEQYRRNQVFSVFSS